MSARSQISATRVSWKPCSEKSSEATSRMRARSSSFRRSRREGGAALAACSVGPDESALCRGLFTPADCSLGLGVCKLTYLCIDGVPEVTRRAARLRRGHEIAALDIANRLKLLTNFRPRPGARDRGDQRQPRLSS